VGAETSERSIVLAPTGRDAPLIVAMLGDLGVDCEISRSVADLADQMQQRADLAIIAEEALRNADVRPIATVLTSQEAWSDLPIILLTRRGENSPQEPEFLNLAELLGNVNFLERPFHPDTLASMVRAASRDRRRQYEARARHEEIIERENQLQTALKAGRLGSWTLDVQTSQLRASETCRRQFGRTADTPFAYSDLLETIHPEDRKSRDVALNAAIATGDDYISEFRLVWPDGSVHWMDVRARALTDDTGKVTRLVGVSSDITAQVRGV
jgi:PAS domain S-box-containing protein